MTKISVIIPVYNAEKTVRRCIETVLNNDYDNFEVIVVDDKSTDNTRKIIEGINEQKLQFFVNEINYGPSFSRNYGIKKSKGDIILLLDADTYVERDWITKHAKQHKEVVADIIGGGIVGIHNTIYGKCNNFCSWLFSIPYSKDYYLTKFLVPTNNMSIKREVFQRIGYFNEDLKKSEDADFCFKALKNDLKIYFKSDLIVYHYDKNDFQEFLKHQIHWGMDTVKMKKRMNMEFSRFFPNSYFMAYISTVPLAIFYTSFIIMRWVKYRPSVLLCAPIIFLGKMKQMNAIKDSFKSVLKGKD